MEKIQMLREAFKSGVTLDISFRKKQLNALYKLLTENVDTFCDALYKDLRKSRHESMMTEIHMMRKEVEYMQYNIDKLAAPEKVAKTFVSMTDATYILRQPFGVVLIIGPWNYPLLVCMKPLVGALAAGNCVLLKPSEVSSATEKAIAELVPKYLDSRCCQVVCAGPEETSELLKERFDLIFYTGSTQVGRLIMQAAAAHLTPVVLELGGKSPAYIDRNCNLGMTAHRVMWAKLLNTGQTCVSVDYVLCHSEVLEEFIEELKKAAQEFYGDDPSTSPDYGRIINERHFKRLNNMLTSTKATVALSGKHDISDLYIAPTILRDVTKDDIVMQSEIFGPILPVISVDSDEEAIDFINEREKPLALYVFTKDRVVMQKFELRTFSGGLVHNDAVIHLGIMGLPFGGIGESGMGNYHGKYSFECFSHKRAVVDKDTNEMFNNMFRYAPYTHSRTSWMNWALSSGKSCSIM